MATYYDKKCPHCGLKYAYWQPKNTALYGSPFRVCSRCGKVFIDKMYKEIAVDGYNEYFLMKVQPFSIFAIVIGIILILVDVLGIKVYLAAVIGGIFLIAGIYFVISDIRDHEKRIAEYKKLKKESEDRLSDPEYAKALKELGYNVPSKYLDNQHLE